MLGFGVAEDCLPEDALGVEYVQQVCFSELKTRLCGAAGNRYLEGRLSKSQEGEFLTDKLKVNRFGGGTYLALALDSQYPGLRLRCITAAI